MSFLTGLFRKTDEPINTYDDFWTWFRKHERTFFDVVRKHGDIERDFFEKISPKLSELNDGIFYLTGMADDHTAELIFTPDGTIKNIVFVEELVRAAPEIKGWKFRALKPALSIENVRIEMSGYSFDRDTLSFYSKEDPNMPDEIHVVIVHKQYNEENKDTITNGVFIFLDNFLGELNNVTSIDEVTITGTSEAEKELIPIEKLKAFLIWREKEFLEKYEGERHDTENDRYAGVEARLKNGRALVATLNTTLLEWDRKASHPWFMTVRINYDGDANNGMPDEDTYRLMDIFENEITNALKDFDGYLNIGRETGDNSREIYFACKEFRKPSKTLHELIRQYTGRLDVSYDIYKDKYWQSMDRYTAHHHLPPGTTG